MPRKPKDVKAAEAAAVNFTSLMALMGNKDPDIVEQAMMTTKEALTAKLPQVPSADQTTQIVKGIISCLVYPHPGVRDAAVSWYVRAPFDVGSVRYC
jgi:hypothetical protein